MILLKGIRFVLLLMAITCLGLLVIDNPGTVKFEWLGYNMKLPIGMFIAVFLLSFIALNFFVNIMKFIWSLPQIYFAKIGKKKLQKGRGLLLDGLSAIAAGQNEEAKEIISVASEMIADDDLTEFIAAQASYMINDEENTTRRYLSLIKNKRTSFLGLRGLLMQAKDRGDYHLAQEYINKSIAIRPDSPWLQSEYLNNSVKLAQKGVFTENDKNRLIKYIPKNLWQRHKAMISWLKLQSNLPINYFEQEKLHLKIFDLAPDWTYNVKKLVDLYIKIGSLSKAQKIIMESFKKQPHRILSELWDTVFCELQPIDRYKTLEKLVNGQESHPESQFSLAQSAIKAQLWGQAEKHLDQFLSNGMTKKGCILMADLVEKKHPANFDLIKEWWMRAAQINVDYSWQCNCCQSSYDKWKLICDNCQEIDKVFWQQTASVISNQIKGELESTKLAHVV